MNSIGSDICRTCHSYLDMSKHETEIRRIHICSKSKNGTVHTCHKHSATSSDTCPHTEERSQGCYAAAPNGHRYWSDSLSPVWCLWTVRSVSGCAAQTLHMLRTSPVGPLHNKIVRFSVLIKCPPPCFIISTTSHIISVASNYNWKN